MIKKKLLSSLSIVFLLLFTLSFTISCAKNNNTIGSSADTDDSHDSAPPPPAPFDLDEAIEMMGLCLQSYQMLIDFKSGTEFTLPEPYTLITQFMSDEKVPLHEDVPLAYIAKDDNNLYLVFRGTKTIDEWIADADFKLIPYPMGNTNAMSERGFTNLYTSMGIIEALNNLDGFDNLYVTGHSLGAALAVVAIPDIIKKTKYKNPIMYSFAGPRVGDQNFKNLYDGLNIVSWRVFNTNDVVPKLPPTSRSYVHVNSGEPITFGKPVRDLFDFKQIAFNHEGCHYYNTLCSMTNDPATCMKKAGGADGCNVSP